MRSPSPRKRVTQQLRSAQRATTPDLESRFRYSRAQQRQPELELSEDEVEEGETKRGVVLIQATLEDLQSLYKIPDDIFELRFSDSGLTPEIIQMLADICEEKNIQRLIFESCEMDDWTKLTKAVTQTKISHLGVHGTSVGNEGAGCLSQLLTVDTHITSLDLVDCRIGDAGIAALGVALMQNTILTLLNLSKNHFTTKGAVLFFRALKGGNSTLQFLSLASTCAGHTEVVMLICALLLRNTDLTHLNLNNTGLSEDGVTLIAESLTHNNNLASLCVARNGLEDGSAHELSVTLSDSVSLRNLDVSSNCLTYRGLHVLLQSSTVQGQIARLDVSDNKVTPRQQADLETLVEDLAMVGVVVY